MALSDYIEDLIYRVLSGEANEVEKQEFNLWLQESGEHQVFFRAVERAWQTGKYAMKWKSVRTSDVWRALERKHAKRKRNRILRIGWQVAAVVVVVVGVAFAFWQPGRKEILEKVVQGAVIKAGESKAILVLSTGEKITLGEDISDTIRESGMSIRKEKDRINYEFKGAVVEKVVYNELIVPVGGEYRLQLADGTTVYMNSESRLKYPVTFSGGSRMVELEGEAYFDVTRDEKSPFVVHTNLVDVKVLGTSFNVMAYREDPRTEVTLVEGKVDVSGGSVREVLTPDRQFVLNHESREVEVRTVNVSSFVDWKNGILNFDSMPLDELCDRLSRWYSAKFFFAKDGLKQLKFSGAVKKYNDIDYILALIEATTDVSFKMDGDVIVVNEK